MDKTLYIDTPQEFEQMMGLLHDLEVLVPDLQGIGPDLFAEVNTKLLELLQEAGTLDLTIDEIALIAYQIALEFDLDISGELMNLLSAESEPVS